MALYIISQLKKTIIIAHIDLLTQWKTYSNVLPDARIGILKQNSSEK